MRYLPVDVSGNAKTGKISAVYSHRATCPPTCPLKGKEGCYAEYGPVRLAWDRTEGDTAVGLDGLTHWLIGLSKRTLRTAANLVRMWVAGDCPGEDGRIDRDALLAIAKAGEESGRTLYGYTHYAPSERNVDTLKAVADHGFVMNLSADNLHEADEFKRTGLPVVALLPANATEGPRSFRTPAGNRVTVCPATYRDDIDCAACKLCAISTRKAIVGFPAHGVKTKAANAVSQGIT
jgi:hypothetical protein